MLSVIQRGRTMLPFQVVKLVAGLIFFFSFRYAPAAEKLINLPVRGDVVSPVYVMTRDDATATVILLPGGDGGIGKISEGKPTSNNFLVRSRELFFQNGLNVVVMGRVSDQDGLDYGYRISGEHVHDIGVVVDYAIKETGKPVWIVGTSRGTVSGTAATIALGNNKVAGLVLTSSVTSRKTGAVPTQKLGSVTVPVLVVHHEKDACSVCRPYEASGIVTGLVAARTKKLVMVKDGADPAGDPCGSQHWHGYINAEKSTVDLIANWIRNPGP